MHTYVSRSFSLSIMTFKLTLTLFPYMKTINPLTRVHSVGRHSFPLSDAGQFLTEVDVGQFAAAVGEEGQQVVVEVLEVQFLVFVAGAREGDHPAGGTFFQARQKQISEEEVTQVIDAKTHAEVIIRPVEDAGHT